MIRTVLPATVILAIAALSFNGCGAPADNAGPMANPAEGHHEHNGDHNHQIDHDDQADHSQADMEAIKAELAKLSPEDAASAEKQHVCPVTGEMLGTMGPPKKVEVDGQQVWICCEGCKDQLLSNPDEYLAKLGN